MHIQRNVSLRAYNTFGIDTVAEHLIVIHDKQGLQEVLDTDALPTPIHIIGGGSNILFTQNVKGTVLLNRTKGIAVVEENEGHVIVEVCSGEVWHELVLYAISKGWGGIENLALIPGTVGAAPMQNIGAYGVEVKDVIKKVKVWHWEEKRYKEYDNADCQFGYRDSIFKHEEKGKVFITSVTFQLSKKHNYHTSYGAIQQELDKMGIKDLSIKAIANAVIAIRSSKLPNPEEIGNAGSFFKNPTIPQSQFEQLKTQHPAIPHYPAGDNMVKVPAGWLIEQCGFKGISKGNTGVHEQQALVLVNKTGQANGKEVWELSEEILQTVQDRFGILLEREVQIW